MPKQKLTIDPVTGELSRLTGKDLPLIGVSGLSDENVGVPFGQSPNAPAGAFDEATFDCESSLQYLLKF